MEMLKKGPFRMPEPMTPYLDKHFPTQSGKFEFMSQFEPDDLPAFNPSYPYALLTVAGFDHICSERTLAEHEQYPEILLNPVEAEKLGLQDGGTAMVKSRIGEIKVRLRFDASIRRDCIVSQRGGWIKAGHGFNRITEDMTSTVGNGTPYYETRVTLQPCSGT